MKRTLAAYIALSTLISGCGFASVKPDQAPPIPHASESTNLTVGLVSEGSTVNGNFMVFSPQFAGTASSEIAPSIPGKIADGLRQTGAFKEVQFPISMGRSADDIDLTMSAKMAIQYVADPMWAAKAFLTGFTLFVASPIIWYGDKYDAKADLIIQDADRREIRRYTENFKVEMSHMMIFPGGANDMMQKGADVAIAALISKLAEDIVRDLPQIKDAAAAASNDVADSAPRRRGTRPAAAAVAAAPAAPAKIRSDVDEVPAGSGKRNGHAVIIGIAHYRQAGMPAAEFADDDAKLVREYVTKTLGFPEENVALLIDGQASKSDFEKDFENWLPNRVEKGDEVFVYFSGHGAPNIQTHDAYLVPWDGDPTYIAKTGYPVEALYAALAKLPASKVTVVLDSCFSGAGGHSVIAAGARPLVNMVPTKVPAKISVLAAAGADEISNTYAAKGHGLFTYYFLKGLKEHPDDFKAAFDYLKPQVSRVARRDLNTQQDPEWQGGN